MKRFFLVGLLWMALAAVGCRDSRPFAVEDFTVERYTPRYASGFDIRSREGSVSSLITVRNPWQGGSGEVQYLYVVRDGEPVPAGFPAGGRGARTAGRLHVVEPCGDVRPAGRGGAHRRGLGHRRHCQRLCRRPQALRRGARRGLRLEPELRAAGGHARRPGAALRRGGRGYGRDEQAPRAGDSLYIYW